MRTEIQNKIYTTCYDGTFAKVTYAKDTHLATKSTTDFLKPVIVVNEVSGVPSQAVSLGARSGSYGMADWKFEARIKFSSEVDTYKFLTEELKPISFIYDNTRIRISSVGAPVVHPPRQGSHNGTEMVITFSVTTRR